MSSRAHSSAFILVTPFHGVAIVEDVVAPDGVLIEEIPALPWCVMEDEAAERQQLAQGIHTDLSRIEASQTRIAATLERRAEILEEVLSR